MNRYAFFFSALLFFPAFSAAQTWNKETKLVAGDRDADQGFGHAVARTDSLAVISAIYEDRDANGANPIGGAGAAYIFQKQPDGSWKQVQKIVASNRKSADRFGQAVGILGTTVFVGAEQHDFDSQEGDPITDAGALYVFEKGSDGLWAQSQKLVAPFRTSQSYFGCSVDAYGKYMIVGARGDRTDEKGELPITNCGSAFIYEKGTDGLWTLNKKVMPITRRFYEQFGCDVAIHGKRIVVGAYRDGVSSTYPDRGAAYIFELDLDDEWMPVQKITPTTRTAEKFGWAVDLNQDIIVVGAFENSAGASQVYSQTGAAYAFKKDNSTGEWVQMTKFVKSNPTQNDHFGYDVSLFNSYLVISARRTSTNTGSIFLFSLSNSANWNSLQSYQSTNAEIGDFFGTSAALYDGKLIIGAPGEDHDLNEENKLDASGAAFILESGDYVSATSLKASDIHVFPNPCSGEFKISSDLTYQPAFIQIRDMKGQLLFEQAVQSGEMIKVDLASGLYLVQVFHDQGSLGISRLQILKD